MTAQLEALVYAAVIAFALTCAVCFIFGVAA